MSARSVALRSASRLRRAYTARRAWATGALCSASVAWWSATRAAISAKVMVFGIGVLLVGEGQQARPAVCRAAAGGMQWGDLSGPAGLPRPAPRRQWDRPAGGRPPT